MTSDGWPLSVQHHAAQGAVRSKAVVVCGHAMFCNKKTLDRPQGHGLASTLAASGIEVWTADLRGHGESGPAPSHSVSISYDDYVRRDIPDLIRAAHQHFPDHRVFLLGHSLAAHAGVAAVSLQPELWVSGIISLAGNVWVRDLEPDGLRWLGKRAVFELFGAAAQVAGRFPSVALNVGTDDEGLQYALQFRQFARENRWGSADGLDNYLLAMSNLRTPVMSVVGRADTWMCRPESAQAWLNRAPLSEVTHRFVGDCPGDPQDIDHMKLVLDARMRSVWTEIADWIHDHC